MPDISMCSNKECPIREECYRFMVKPGINQSYSLFEFDKEEGCDYFMNDDVNKL
jgi:hypothetical protein